MGRLKVAFGPAWRAGNGSWEWLGADLSNELSKYFDVSFFGTEKVKHLRIVREVEGCDVVVVVKHRWSLTSMVKAARRVIYAPVDVFKSGADVDEMSPYLSKCSVIVAQSPTIHGQMVQFCKSYLIDHHIKHFSKLIQSYKESGPVLYVGVGSNMPFIVDWFNLGMLNWPLLVLTSDDRSASRWGFSGGDVTCVQWTPERHLDALNECRAAIDIKGSSFWQTTKPATKAMDYIASGLPFAINPGSDAHVSARSFVRVCLPSDTGRWFSREYWTETQRAANRIRCALSLDEIGLKWKQVIEEAVSD